MKRFTRLIAGAACVCSTLAGIGSAQPPNDAAPSSAISADVATAYDTYHIRPMWLRGGLPTPAASALAAVLDRAAFDGFPQGPQFAREVRAGVAQAQSGSPRDQAAAERILSTAWVAYVQALRRPTRGMIYAFPLLKPSKATAESILLTAAAAPSLEQHLIGISRVNPIYAQLRDTAWAEAQAYGNLAPDPRLLANLDRARSIPASGRFVVVDSATQLLTLFENGQPADSMKVIVGTHELPTPLIASVMYYVTFNPYWHAPDHLVRKTIAPNYLRLGPGYFRSHGYEILANWTDESSTVDPSTVDWKAVAKGDVHLLIRQAPGVWNSMGKLKFPFPNTEDIYLHDTPNKALFAQDARDLSNGCVRVEDARRLGRWLLGRDPVAPGSEPEIRVRMPQGVPIILTYVTAQIRDGKIVYLPDIYGWDAAPRKQVAASE